MAPEENNDFANPSIFTITQTAEIKHMDEETVFLNTMLSAAVRAGIREIAEIALQAGAELHCLNEDGLGRLAGLIPELAGTVSQELSGREREEGIEPRWGMDPDWAKMINEPSEETEQESVALQYLTIEFDEYGKVQGWIDNPDGTRNILPRSEFIKLFKNWLISL